MTNEEMAGRLITDAPAAPLESIYKATIPEPDLIFKRLPITLKATPAQQEYAREITVGRQRGKHLADPSATIGTAELDFEATYYGTLAELVFYQWLEQEGAHPEYTLLDTKAVTKADFTIDDVRYEVKCSPPGKVFLAINQKQHHDPQRICDYYVLSLFEASDVMQFCPIRPHSDISQWQSMTNGHAPYYSLHRSDLLSPAPLLAVGDREQTRAFLAALMQNYDDTLLRIEVRPAFPPYLEHTLYPQGDAPGNWQFLLPTGKREWFPLSEAGIDQMTEHAQELARRYEVYFGVLPRIGRNGKAADVPTTGCLWADIDGGFEGVEGAQRLLDAAILAGRLPAPHFVICSGGGLHVYWLLSAPVRLSDDLTRLRFKNTLKRLCRVIGGYATAAHADTSRADVASILRIPGTFNRKRELEPRPVRLLSCPAAEAHTLTWWNANLPAIPLPPAPKYPPIDRTQLKTYQGLIRWAEKGYPEGKRHKDFAGAAKWLVHDLGLDKASALQLLTMKAQASAGQRAISMKELEAIIEWA